MTEIQKIPYDNKAGRVETGPVQFGDDWPGYFIRGDNAFGLAMAIQSLMVNPYDVIMAMQVREFGKDLMSCVQGDVSVGLLVESADTAALKPADSGHEGSSPSEPTIDLNSLTPIQVWKSQMPSSECDIQIGQRRIFFIDGIGDMEGKITAFDDEACWLLVDGDPEEAAWWVPWNPKGGMTHVSLIVDGEEHKKWLAQAEEEAINARPTDTV